MDRPMNGNKIMVLQVSSPALPRSDGRKNANESLLSISAVKIL
jgi:hypothetical protein